MILGVAMVWEFSIAASPFASFSKSSFAFGKLPDLTRYDRFLVSTRSVCAISPPEMGRIEIIGSPKRYSSCARSKGIRWISYKSYVVYG